MANPSQNKALGYLLQAQHCINAALGAMTGVNALTGVNAPQRTTPTRTRPRTSTGSRRGRAAVTRIKGAQQGTQKAA